MEALLSTKQKTVFGTPGHLEAIKGNGPAVIKKWCAFNRPFPSSKKFHFQNEAKCETFVVKMSFNFDANKTHFHNKGFALSLVLKVKLFGTRK